MNVDNQQGVAFGRRGRESRAQPVLAGRTVKPARPVGHILRLVGLTSLVLVVAGAVFWALSAIQKLNAETARAEQRVVQIVNQPITHMPRSGQWMEYSPGWFHPGAIKPDFSNVDIRATQEFPYASSDHVTSDLNPTEMFIGDELEFNAMTKYFYTDRALPKKRLSNAEMIKINNLYRIVGHDEQAISMRWLMIAGLVVVGFCLGSLLLLHRGFRPAD